MANAVYPKWKEAIIQSLSDADLDGSGATGVYAALIDADYTYSSAHDFYDDVTPASNAVGTDQEIGATKSYTNGTFDGADCVFSAVTGNQVTQLVLYRKNAGANTTWRLVLFLDTSVTGLPVTPNGGDITIQWNGSGIFTISDARMKKDIREVGRVGELGVYEYRYVGQAEIQIGLIAQEVERVFPCAVREFDGIKAVNYNHVAERLAA